MVDDFNRFVLLRCEMKFAIRTGISFCILVLIFEGCCDWIAIISKSSVNKINVHKRTKLHYKNNLLSTIKLVKKHC